MVFIKESINLFPNLFSYSSLDDPIENGQDIKFLNILEKTIELQENIGTRLKMKTIVPPKPYTMFNIDEVIKAINDNFLAIEQKLNEIASNEEYVEFDNLKEITMFFNDYGKLVSISVSNDKLSINTEDSSYTLNVSDGSMIAND